MSEATTRIAAQSLHIEMLRDALIDINNICGLDALRPAHKQSDVAGEIFDITNIALDTPPP